MIALSEWRHMCQWFSWKTAMFDGGNSLWTPKWCAAFWWQNSEK